MPYVASMTVMDLIGNLHGKTRAIIRYVNHDIGIHDNEPCEAMLSPWIVPVSKCEHGLSDGEQCLALITTLGQTFTFHARNMPIPFWCSAWCDPISGAGREPRRMYHYTNLAGSNNVKRKYNKWVWRLLRGERAVMEVSAGHFRRALSHAGLNISTECGGELGLP